MSKKCNCSNCSEGGEFNAEAAYEQLFRKYTTLTDIVVQYMSEANLKRPERAENAFIMADFLNRIVGGQPTTDFRECCLIGNQSRFFCTGVLVHPRIVLTAAHCQSEGITRVRLNCTTEFDVAGKEIGVQKARVHPAYTPINKIHDIAVLILLPNDSVTPPIQIATTQEMQNAQDTTLVGFGHSNFSGSAGFGLKRQVSVGIDRPQNINEAEARLGFESDLEFTAGGNGRDTCNGDSGGPAYITANGILKVAGLTSRPYLTFNQPCGEGGIYTRIDVHQDFIRQVAQQSGINF
jgi:secreted trypsin-like serine protease